MTPPPSIRRRLSMALIGISVAWGVTVSAVVGLAVYRQVDKLQDHALQEAAEIVFGLLSFDAGQLPSNGSGILPAPAHDEDLVWQLVRDGQGVLLHSHRAPSQPLLLRPTAGFATVGNAWRVYGMVFGEGRMLYVAQRGPQRAAARMQATSISAGVALVIGLLGALALRRKVGQELQSISEMSVAVARFDPLAPDARLADPSRQELVAMHDAVADLGARLAKLIANERSFSAHAAHALRTPLAGMVAQLAVAQRLSPAEAQPQLQRARQAADRLRRVVSSLLTLFRSGGEAQWQTVDLGRLVGHLPFEQLTVTTEPGATVQADPDLLGAALMNLLENSLRHGATEVAVTARHERGCVHVRVCDNGSGIPGAERESLQAALDRQDYETHVGLGLMLADLVARAHGGHLDIPAVPRGCVVDIGLGPQAQGVIHRTDAPAETDGPD